MNTTTFIQTNGAIKKAANACVEPLRNLRIFLLQEHDWLNREETIDQLRKDVADSPSPEAAQVVMQRIAELSNRAAAEYEHVIRKRARELHDLGKNALLQALGVAKSEVQAAQADAVKAERAFFAGHSMPWEATPVSRAWQPVLDRIDAAVVSLTNPARSGRRVPDISRVPAVEMLGISIG